MIEIFLRLECCGKTLKLWNYHELSCIVIFISSSLSQYIQLHFGVCRIFRHIHLGNVALREKSELIGWQIDWNLLNQSLNMHLIFGYCWEHYRLRYEISCSLTLIYWASRCTLTYFDHQLPENDTKIPSFTGYPQKDRNYSNPIHSIHKVVVNCAETIQKSS